MEISSLEEEHLPELEEGSETGEMAAPVANQTMETAEGIYEESTVHLNCEEFVEQLKSTSMAGALRKYRNLLGDLVHIGGGAAAIDVYTAVLNNKVCLDLRNVVIQNDVSCPVKTPCPRTRRGTAP